MDYAVILPQPNIYRDWVEWGNTLITQLEDALAAKILVSGSGGDGGGTFISGTATLRDSLGRIILSPNGHFIYGLTGTQIVSGPVIQINTEQLVDAAITTQKLALGAVGPAQLAELAVEASKLATYAVKTVHLDFGAVGGPQITAGAITETKISDNAITTPKLAAGSVTAAKITASAITADKIEANAVTSGKIAAGAVVAGKLATNAIVAGDGVIANAAITTALIGDLQVTNAKIADLAGSKILAGSITTDKLTVSIITANYIDSNAIQSNHISAGVINANHLSAGSVTSAKIAANAIGATHISAGAVVAGKIAANAITAAGGEIANLAVGTLKIATGAVSTFTFDIVSTQYYYTTIYNSSVTRQLINTTFYTAYDAAVVVEFNPFFFTADESSSNTRMINRQLPTNQGDILLQPYGGTYGGSHTLRLRYYFQVDSNSFTLFDETMTTNSSIYKLGMKHGGYRHVVYVGAGNHTLSYYVYAQNFNAYNYEFFVQGHFGWITLHIFYR